MRTAGLLVQETPDELLVYDLSSNKALCLNETSQKVFQYCNGESNFDQISEKSGIPKELVWLAIEEFQKNNLLEFKVETELPKDRVTRRKVLIKAGAAAIALPMIASLVAPLAAQGLSCLAPNSILLGGAFCGVPAAVCQPTCNANAGPCCSMVGTTSLGCPDCFCICA